jgi:hypothetical protein
MEVKLPTILDGVEEYHGSYIRGVLSIQSRPSRVADVVLLLVVPKKDVVSNMHRVRSHMSAAGFRHSVLGV